MYASSFLRRPGPPKVSASASLDPPRNHCVLYREKELIFKQPRPINNIPSRNLERTVMRRRPLPIDLHQGWNIQRLDKADRLRQDSQTSERKWYQY